MIYLGGTFFLCGVYIALPGLGTTGPCCLKIYKTEVSGIDSLDNHYFNNNTIILYFCIYFIYL